MPTSWPDGKSVLPKVLDGQPATQIEAIWAYLAQGQNAQAPPGTGAKSIPLVPTTEAIIYRHFPTKQALYTAVRDYRAQSPEFQESLERMKASMERNDD